MSLEKATSQPEFVGQLPKKENNDKYNQNSPSFTTSAINLINKKHMKQSISGYVDLDIRV